MCRENEQLDPEAADIYQTEDEEQRLELVRSESIEAARVLEPDAVYTPRSHIAADKAMPWAEYTAVHVTDADTGETLLFERLQAPSWHPDPVMRSKGYTRNPARCPHNRVRFLNNKWICSECGTATES